MKPRLSVLLPLSLIALAALACGGAEEAEPRTEQPPAAAQDDGALRSFLGSTEGTYGWETQGGTLSDDFFADGRVHMQGPDGEATMWTGQWALAGDQLTITEPNHPTETFTVARDGDRLLLNGTPWTRYKP